jgi:hypothetical protein
VDLARHYLQVTLSTASTPGNSFETFRNRTTGSLVSGDDISGDDIPASFL